MPGTVHVKVVKARDLPVMDKRSELTDAFVEIKLGSGWSKTEVCPKTLHPQWNSQWSKFNVTDEELQDEPLQLKVMDHDLYSAHDAIGRVYIILNPLVESGSTHSSLEGWFPIFDTLHGVRGEIYVQVKLDVIQDKHRFKQSSFGIKFYSCTAAEPDGLAIRSIHGFIEELVVNDDPEYQWIDRLRTPRASNEARQRLFSKLSGELRRRIGAKALEVEANAVLGYKQFFDIEGESGVVVRGIGTCVSLIPKPPNLQVPIPVSFPVTLEGVRPISIHADPLMIDDSTHYDSTITTNPQLLTSPQHSHITLTSKASPGHTDGLPASPAKVTSKLLNDPLLTTPSGSGAANVLSTTPPLSTKHNVTATSEYPFYTVTTLPEDVLTHIGGLVTARSVKLLDKINNPDDPETRDAWWREVRDEMRSHLRVMGCTVIIGYSESTSICDTLCVFSATGTAVTVTETLRRPPISPGSDGDVRAEFELEGQHSSHESPVRTYTTGQLGCTLCHLPYSTSKLPDMKATFCRICRRCQVPPVILSTTGLPSGVLVRGKGCLVQTRVCVPKKKMKGEDNAFKISKELPFLEYNLHSRLMNKVYVCGMNAVFGLKIQVSVGDTVITGLATGTAVYLEPLPPPPTLSFQSKEGSQQSISASDTLDSLQSAVDRALQTNRLTYGLLQPSLEVSAQETGSDVMAFDEGTPTEPDLTAGKKDVFLVDISDMNIDGGNIYSIIDRPLPSGYHLSNISLSPGVTAVPNEGKMVTIVKKAIFNNEHRATVDKQFSNFLTLLMQGLCFKVRDYHPCLLSDVQFDIDLPEEDEIQVSVTAFVNRIQQDKSEVKVRRQKRISEEYIFDMDHETSEGLHRPSLLAEVGPHDIGKVVLMSPAPSIAGWSVKQYLGTVNIFVIKESTSIRESGGLGVFLNIFILEANSMVRANVKSMAGNALLNYQLNKCVLIDHPYKNQAQCLLNISGDAVKLVSSSSSIPHDDVTSAVDTSSTSPTETHNLP